MTSRQLRNFRNEISFLILFNDDRKLSFRKLISYHVRNTVKKTTKKYN